MGWEEVEMSGQYTLEASDSEIARTWPLGFGGRRRPYEDSRRCGQYGRGGILVSGLEDYAVLWWSE